MAAQNGHLGVIDTLLSNRRNSNLHPKLDINKANLESATPLFIAAGNGHVNVFEVFVKIARYKCKNQYKKRRHTIFN